MNREYQKWYSTELHRDMEMLVFGHAGTPVVVFPTSMAPYFEWEDRQMVAALGHRIESGAIQLFCVHSVDSESWYNKQVHPRDRVLRHMQYERYILTGVLPFIRMKNASPELGVTGCSFGGFHAVNFALRHPDLVTACVSMGGAFDIAQFLNGYYDDNCYFNCPLHFLPNMGDEWYLRQYRERVKFVLATGEHDMCWDANEKLAGAMREKGIPHSLDVWRDGTGHDWPWWQRMVQKFF